MKVKHFILFSFIIFPFLLQAQSNDNGADTSSTTNSHLSPRMQRKLQKRQQLNKLIAQEEDGALVFRKQWAIGLKLNTDGYGFFYEHGKYKSLKRSNLWWLEFGEKKSQNQTKQSPQPTITSYPGFSIVSVGNSFVYGKENNFYQLKVGFGRQLRIGSKGSNNGVAVSAIYGGGLSLGLQKPYYLQVLDSTSQSGTTDIRYSDNPTKFLDLNSIVGGSGFSKGFGSMTVVPGLHARGALRFDYGKDREVLSALEVGFNLDYYTQKITIMAQNPARNLFFDTYVAIDFGGRK